MPADQDALKTTTTTTTLNQQTNSVIEAKINNLSLCYLSENDHEIWFVFSFSYCQFLLLFRSSGKENHWKIYSWKKHH